jgi:hypothetical protein
LKSKLQADAEHDWNASLEWIRDQAKLEMLSCNNEIDGSKTSKQNNNVGDNNNGGTRPIVKKRMVAREMTRAAAVTTMNNTRTIGTKQIKRALKLNFGRPIQMWTMRRLNKIELRKTTKKVTIHKKTVK